MSWSFSPVLVAAFLEECCLDTAQSVQSNTTPTPDQYYWPDKPTEHSRISRFGMTQRRWTCSGCGAVHDRDVNAARNILAAGHRRLAAGITVSSGR